VRRLAIGVLVSAIVVGAGALLWRFGDPARNQDPLAPVSSQAIEGARSWISRFVEAIDFSGTGRSAAFSGYVEADYVRLSSDDRAPSESP
jgi:hypothetical protein